MTKSKRRYGRLNRRKCFTLKVLLNRYMAKTWLHLNGATVSCIFTFIRVIVVLPKSTDTGSLTISHPDKWTDDTSSSIFQAIDSILALVIQTNDKMPYATHDHHSPTINQSRSHRKTNMMWGWGTKQVIQRSLISILGHFWKSGVWCGGKRNSGSHHGTYETGCNQVGHWYNYPRWPCGSHSHEWLFDC